MESTPGAPPRVFVVQGIRYKRPPPPWIAYSVGAHVVLLGALGFVRIFGAGGLDAWRTDAPPPNRIALRREPHARIDLDARLGPEPDGHRATELSAGAELSDHDESKDAKDALDVPLVRGDPFFIEGQREAPLGWGARTAGAGVVAQGIGVGVGPGRPRFGSGSGSGGGRRRGGDRGGRRELVARGGGSEATEYAVAQGLRWLARHQAPDGSWGAALSPRCIRLPCREDCGVDESNEVGLTALALIAFLDAGYAPRSVEVYRDEVSGRPVSPGDVVARGLGWLVDRIDAQGRFQNDGRSSASGDAIATYALADACGRFWEPRLRDRAGRAVASIVARQNPHAGWRYDEDERDTDTSVTAWCILALHAARRAGFTISNVAFADAAEFVVGVTNADGRVGYIQGDEKTKPPMESLLDDRRLGNTPAGLLCRMFAGGPRDASFERGEALVLANLPRGVRASDSVKTNFTYWYYGSLALLTSDGPEGEKWRRWNTALVGTLVGRQASLARGDDCASGSWDPDKDLWAAGVGGRVLATALNTLTLEVYYRAEPLVTPTEKR